MCIITFASRNSGENRILVETNSDEEKYSRGRRGAPAKGVGRATGARVQIPLSPFFSLLLFKWLLGHDSKKLKKIKKVVDKLKEM